MNDLSAWSNCDIESGERLTPPLARLIVALHNHGDWLPCRSRVTALVYLANVDD